MVTMQVLSRAQAEAERQRLEAEILAALGTVERDVLRRVSMTSGTAASTIRSVERLAELDFLLDG